MSKPASANARPAETPLNPGMFSPSVVSNPQVCEYTEYLDFGHGCDD
jgi:hypothetical protein